MRKISLILMLLSAVVAHSKKAVAADSPLSWPGVARAGQFKIKPMADRRVGFKLDEHARGRRVVVAIRAFAESKTAAGYNDGALAVDVNGEIMRPRLAGKPRLLNSPEKITFGPNGKRSTRAWREEIGRAHV